MILSLFVEKETDMLHDIITMILSIGWIWLVLTIALLVVYVIGVIVKGNWNI